LPEIKKMAYQSSRISWDTSVKHYIRNGLYENIPNDIRTKISRTNKHRWENETDSKYLGCEVAHFIKEELELIKRTGESRNAKKVLEAYFKLSDTYHTILDSAKGVKQLVAKHKEKLVNAIELVKDFIPVENAIKVFNISRATYHNYKTLVINKCDSSYFLWCVKHYPHQLLKREISQIKKYLENPTYKYWSKSSVYLVALRNKEVSFCLATFYKYSKLLGHTSNRHLQPKIKYGSLTSYQPNQIWCADVTILKTLDNKKQYIHFLIDHYSKKILGYCVEDSSSPKAIKNLLQEAYLKYKNSKPIQLVTDGGTENVNTTVQNFLDTTNLDIIQLIAQKDIPFSNSQMEAINKIMKHQFLLPQQLENRKQLLLALATDVLTYNTIRPQISLQGNTPDETFEGKTIAIMTYKTHFLEQKLLRTTNNQQNACKGCKY
jgi:putative transposase